MAMSNANVVSSIESLLRKVQRGEIQATAFDDQLDGYVSALEGLSGEQRLLLSDDVLEFR